MINTKHGSCVGWQVLLGDCFDFEKNMHIRKKTKNAEKMSSCYTNTALCSLHYYCLHFLAKMIRIAKQESNPDQSIWIRVLQRYWRKRQNNRGTQSSKKLKKFVNCDKIKKIVQKKISSLPSKTQGYNLMKSEWAMRLFVKLLFSDITCVIDRQ